MPEAAIDKDGDLALGKDDVWPHTEVVQPEQQVFAIAIPKPVKCGTQHDLRLGVAAPVGLHVARTTRVQRSWIQALGVSPRAGRRCVILRHAHPTDYATLSSRRSDNARYPAASGACGLPRKEAWWPISK
jgi:hypothetical protein